ncbi:MAG: DnaJ C-terminal domain-containing protein [Microthrixaceae bacterium]
MRVHVEVHPVFHREGDDLTLTVPVTFAEAVLGADLKVPTLEGDPVTIRIPAGTPSGRRFRVKGRGFHHGSTRGDLMVTVEVIVPTQLTDAERAAVETLRDAGTPAPRSHLGV